MYKELSRREFEPPLVVMKRKHPEGISVTTHYLSDLYLTLSEIDQFIIIAVETFTATACCILQLICCVFTVHIINEDCSTVEGSSSSMQEELGKTWEFH